MSGLLVGSLACVIGAVAAAGRNLTVAVALCVIAVVALGYAVLEVMGFI
jgi:hypothetical protein